MFDWLFNLFFPPQASTVAGHVDSVYMFLLTVAGFFTGLIYILIIVFMIRYRRSRRPVAEQVAVSLLLEVTWTAVPFVIAMVIFVWGAKIYWRMYNTPAQA